MRSRKVKPSVVSFHREAIDKHDLSDFFKRNPDIEKYFLNRVHRPLLSAISELRKNPNWLSIRRATRIYFRLENYLLEATVKTEDGRLVPHLDEYLRRMNIRKRHYYGNIKYGALSGALSAMVGRYAVSGPNPVNVGFSLITGGFAALDTYSAIKARTQNPIGYRLAKAIRSQEDLDKVTKLIYDHYTLLGKELKKAIMTRRDVKKEQQQ